MQFLGKIFTKKKNKENLNKFAIKVYLDTQLKRSIIAQDQTVEVFSQVNQFQPEQFLYLEVKNQRTKQMMLKRKLNNYEYLGSVIKQLPQGHVGYIIIGYSGEQKIMTRTSNLTLTDQMKFIRSGILYKYSDTNSTFQQFQIRLHHDYLTYYKNKAKQKKVSFMPLQNSTVQMVNEKKYIFRVRDKFKSIELKSTSREDMIGWLIAINEAIKIRNAQIYMNELNDRLTKKIKEKINVYCKKCISIRDQNKSILYDEIGRKALRSYFKKYQVPEIDWKLLSIIESYMYMCRSRREKGQIQSDQISEKIRQSIQQVSQTINGLSNNPLKNKNDIVKAIQQIMRELDKKYKKQLLEKKILYQTFQTHPVQQYKRHHKIAMKSLFGTVSVNEVLNDDAQS